MHFFNMLHTLKSLLENIGAGNDVLEWEKNNCHHQPLNQHVICICQRWSNLREESINLELPQEEGKWNVFSISENQPLPRRTGMPQKTTSPHKPAVLRSTMCYLCLLIPFSWISVSPLCFPVLLLWCGSRSSISATLWFASEKSPEELSESKPV